MFINTGLVAPLLPVTSSNIKNSVKTIGKKPKKTKKKTLSIEISSVLKSIKNTFNFLIPMSSVPENQI